MKETDNIQMEINIGGERLSLTVPFRDQNMVRDTERRISDLFQSWSARYPSRKSREIMAMVAYRFAYLYGELEEQIARATALAEHTERKLEKLARGLDHDSTEESDSKTEPSEAEATEFFTDY